MPDERLISVSPKHAVYLDEDYVPMIDRAPRQDYVVRTIAKRTAGSLPLMTADLVIAGEETRASHPLAEKYPLHFRKMYFPGRLHGDPAAEFEAHQRASELIGIPAPIGYTGGSFRSCLLPGMPYKRLSPLGVSPEDANIRKAADLPLPTVAGLWTFATSIHNLLTKLHDAGLCHGDAQLQNFIVCPQPLEVLPIDFEMSIFREKVDDATWQRRTREDFVPLLTEAICLMCGLGEQPDALGTAALGEIASLFSKPERFIAAMERNAGRGGGT
jgi:hypothetical protein